MTSYAWDTCSCGCSGDGLSGNPSPIHDEAAFRYFLSVEHERARKTRASIMLLLLSIRETPGRSEPIPAATARQIRSALWDAVRSVDLIGWFRDRHVIGVLLVEYRAAGGTDLLRTVQLRIVQHVASRLPKRQAARVRVRTRVMRPDPRE